MGQAISDYEQTGTVPIHVVVLNNYKFNGNINIKVAEESAKYTVKHLLTATINALQQIHHPTTYHIHYISFNEIRQSNPGFNKFHKKNHIKSQQIYYSNDIETFESILNSEIKSKELFKFQFLTECDIEIPINVHCLFNEKYNLKNWKLSIWYQNRTLVRDILNTIIFYLNSKHKNDANITFANVQILDQHSFCKNSQKNYPITYYKNISQIHKLGINIELVSNPINCPYIVSKPDNNRNICPIYEKMIENTSNVSTENHKHLCLFNHLRQECPYSYHCPSYIRLTNNGNNCSDIYHLKLYRHPSLRSTNERHQILKQNMSHFFQSKNEIETFDYFAVYLPSFADEERFDFSYSDLLKNGYLQPLIQDRDYWEWF